MKQDKNLIKNILLVVTMGLVLLFAIILYATSFSFYSDEYGTDISFSKDYLVCVIVGLILLFYSIVNLINYRKNKYNKSLLPVVSGVSTLILTFYSLGAFLKPLFKGISKGSDLGAIFKENQTYLYFGIVGLFVLAIIIISNLDLFKKKN